MKTYFSNLHPLTIFLYYCFLAVISMASKNLVLLCIIFIGLVFYIQFFSRSITTKKVFFTFLFFCFIVVLNMITNPRGITILFYISNRPFTLESALFGVVLAFSIINLLLTFMAGKINFNSTDFLYIFAPILPKTALLISMSITFTKKFIIAIEKLTVLLRAKGIRTDEGDYKTKINGGNTILGAVVTYSLEESLMTADSMKARGYGICKRSSYRYHKISSRDIFYICIIILLTLLLLFEVKGIFLFGIIFLMMPYFEEWRFALKWRLSKQKS